MRVRSARSIMVLWGILEQAIKRSKEKKEKVGKGRAGWNVSTYFKWYASPLGPWALPKEWVELNDAIKVDLVLRYNASCRNSIITPNVFNRKSTEVVIEFDYLVKEYWGIGTSRRPQALCPQILTWFEVTVHGTASWEGILRAERATNDVNLPTKTKDAWIFQNKFEIAYGSVD